jgi:hypothetical protein
LTTLDQLWPVRNPDAAFVGRQTWNTFYSLLARCCRVMPVLLLALGLAQPARAGAAAPQYLLFHIFIGGVDPTSGVYYQSLAESDIRAVAANISAAVRPKSSVAKRILGFDIGPISMDQGAAGARSAISEAFDVALATNMAVAIHLDDHMFWKQAAWPNGALLLATPGTTEWTAWSGAPAGALYLSWVANTNLAPQLCYESPTVQGFVNYWLEDVIGPELKSQYDRLVQAGKPQLFAGVVAGWESNLSYGYCSISHLGFSAQHPPADFEHEREIVLQRYIARWAQLIHQSGIPTSLIFTHLATITAEEYAQLSAALTPAQICALPGSTTFRAPWTAFNPYSNSGWSAYVDQGRFEDIYGAVQAQGASAWAIAEGTNVALGASYPGGAGPSPLDWETYLAASFNHGAALVNIFGAFQGETGAFQSAESAGALAAYRKFLQGGVLVESQSP